MSERKKNVLMTMFYMSLLIAGKYMGQSFLKFTHPKPRSYFRNLPKSVRKFYMVPTGIVKVQRGKEYPIMSCNYQATQSLR